MVGYLNASCFGLVYFAPLDIFELLTGTLSVSNDKSITSFINDPLFFSGQPTPSISLANRQNWQFSFSFRGHITNFLPVYHSRQQLQRCVESVGISKLFFESNVEAVLFPVRLDWTLLSFPSFSFPAFSSSSSSSSSSSLSSCFSEQDLSWMLKPNW